jgi:redox-sensitive bicupin YhaK (pirin superfamily)
MTAATTSSRAPVRVTQGQLTSDGAGVRLRRLMGGPHSPSIDPFLMLDFFDSPNANDYIAGFPTHPHRGFETVTYMLAGQLRHRDNHGHEGVIETGGVQWMTAGRGIVHSEMPEQREGLMRGFQLWVNLPARLKMSAPAYQEYDADRMPVEVRDGATAKVIAGSTSQGSSGPISTAATRAFYFDIALEAGARFVEPIDPSLAAFVVVHEGALRIGDHPHEIKAVALAALGEGAEVAFTAGNSPARALLIGGQPLREPVAWHGPFVMNTYEELVQAVVDFQAGRF